nr:MAG: movement protein [Capillovirus sp.]
MSIVRVNDFAIRADQSEIKIDALQAGEVYKDAFFLNRKVLNCIRRFESNIKVVGSGVDDSTISEFQLLDDDELRWISGKAGEFNYIHFGAVLFCVTPLVPNFSDLKGEVVIFDKTIIGPRGHIATYELNFEKGPAYFIFRPAHCLSVTDPHLQDAFRVGIKFEGLQCAPGREVFSLDVGVMYRLANSTRFLGESVGKVEWFQQEIRGANLLCSGAREDFWSPKSELSVQSVEASTKVRPGGLFKNRRISRRRSYRAFSRKTDGGYQSFPELPPRRSCSSCSSGGSLGKFRSSSFKLDKSRSEIFGKYECPRSGEGGDQNESEEVHLDECGGSGWRSDRGPASSSSRASRRPAPSLQ